MKSKKNRNIVMKDGVILLLIVMIISLVGSSVVALNTAFSSSDKQYDYRR